MGERDLRDTLLTRIRESKPQYEEHDIPGLGRIFVKRLNVGEKDSFEKSTPGTTIRRAATIIHCCFDERGARIFADSDIHDVEMLDEPWVDDICKAALKLNGYTKEEQEAIAKNSNGQAVAS